MASINELKQLNLHDIAERLGLRRGKGKNSNYHSPTHEDKSPSLNIYQRHGKWFWNDYSGPDEAKGSILDLIMYVEGGDLKTAIKRAHALAGIPMDRAAEQTRPQREQTREEYVASQCKKSAFQVQDYLCNVRKIPEEIVSAGINAGAIGFNTWVNKKAQPGEDGYGGPAAAFIVRTLNPGQVKAVDLRYVDPETNGGRSQHCVGEKAGYPFFTNLENLKRADTVYVVESPINVLSIESCKMPFTSAIAVRAIKALEKIDWSWFYGKQIIVCTDNDEPDEHGRCAGQEAAWMIYDLCTSLNISALLVDQSKWERNDVNDILREDGLDELKIILKRLQPWALQGLPGRSDMQKGRSRLWLPTFDYSLYWRYRVKHDFTSYVSEYKDDGETGEKKEKFDDVCGFRVASITRIKVASANSVLSGGQDLMPQTLFAVNVQAPRHGPELQRRVFEDEELHNTDKWTKFGPVYKKAQFSRLINIMERSADLASKEAINFVGLGWLRGQLMVNEGANCYFQEPRQQCPYSELIFPSGTMQQGAMVMEAYSETFKKNAGLITLVWSLGAHLKAFLGFWPHLVMQAKKGAGKSTFTKSLEQTIGMIMFGRQTIDTAFRVLTSVCHTSQPIGWEEISAGKQDIIDAAVSTLQQCYQYTLTKRGAKLIDFLMSAPVLLAGEDVLVNSLEGKLVRTDLNHGKGQQLPRDLPAFPVHEWLHYLAKKTKQEVQELYDRSYEYLKGRASAKEDTAADRMIKNYACLATAYSLLCEFTGVDRSLLAFPDDLVEQMNRHMIDTESDREPWVWIVDTVLSEIDAGRFRHPYAWGTHELKHEALYIRHRDMIHHIAHNAHMRDFWNSLPIKSAKVLKQHLEHAGVILTDQADKHIGHKRCNHMLALSVEVLERYGLNVAYSEGGQEEAF